MIPEPFLLESLDDRLGTPVRRGLRAARTLGTTLVVASGVAYLACRLPDYSKEAAAKRGMMR